MDIRKRILKELASACRNYKCHHAINRYGHIEQSMVSIGDVLVVL